MYHVIGALQFVTITDRPFSSMVEFELVGRVDGPAYDSDQDAAEKRDIRKKYRLLEKKTGGAYDASFSSPNVS